MYNEIVQSSESSEDDVVVQMEIMRQNAQETIRMERLRTPRKFTRRNLQEGHDRLWNAYFADNCTESPKKFRRRFRMTRGLFDRVLNGVVQQDSYFVQKQDAFGRLGLSTHQKVIAAFRMLAFGVSADIWGEHIGMGESTVQKCVERFCAAVLQHFGPTYLRKPTLPDVMRLYDENAKRGFPGMLGSIDCMHWLWKNCPTAWHGQYKGHAAGPSIILEAVASYDTWIWSAFFGMPGSANDINVLHRSTVFHDLLYGKSPKVPFSINNHTYQHGYYLADGIYPPYATIVQAVRAPTTRKQRQFKQAQEGARKDVERAFGILQARWGFIRQPARLWDKDKINMVMKTCILLHNMIVEDEQRSVEWDYEYEQYVAEEETEEDSEDEADRQNVGQTVCELGEGSGAQPEQLVDGLLLPRDATQEFRNMLDRDKELRDKQVHQQLQKDLIEHIWEMYSNSS